MLTPLESFIVCLGAAFVIAWAITHKVVTYRIRKRQRQKAFDRNGIAAEPDDNEMSPDYETCFELGRGAAAMGEEPSANPFKSLPEQGAVWLKGWSLGDVERRGWQAERVTEPTDDVASRFGLPNGRNLDSSSESLSIEEAYELSQSISRRMMEREREANESLRDMRCRVCRHVPRLEGSRMFVCKHLLTYLRRHSERADSDNDWPIAGVPLGSVQLVLEEPERTQNEYPLIDLSWDTRD